MALELILDDTAFLILPEETRKLYKKNDADGKYHLDVVDDAREALLRAKTHEKERRQKAEADLAELKEKARIAEEAAAKAKDDAARKAGDTEALEASWRERAEREVAAEKAKTEAATKALNLALKTNVAREIATRISITPDLLTEAIEKRLTVEITTDGIAVTRVLDAMGRPSAMAVKDLEKEFIDNKTYAPIIKASDASGGGAKGGQDGGGGVHGITKLSDFKTATEEAAFANANPAAYAALK